MRTKFSLSFTVALLGAAVALHAADKPKATTPPVIDPYAEVQPVTESLDMAMYQRIRDEGTQPLACDGVCLGSDGRNWSAPDRLAECKESQ